MYCVCGTARLQTIQILANKFASGKFRSFRSDSWLLTPKSNLHAVHPLANDSNEAFVVAVLHHGVEQAQGTSFEHSQALALRPHPKIPCVALKLLLVACLPPQAATVCARCMSPWSSPLRALCCFDYASARQVKWWRDPCEQIRSRCRWARQFTQNGTPSTATVSPCCTHQVPCVCGTC